MKHCLFKDCQKEFEPNKPKQIFCSAKCRVYFSRSLKPKKIKNSEIINNAPKVDNSEIEKQIALIKAETKPSIISQSKFDSYKLRKIFELQKQLQ